VEEYLGDISLDGEPSVRSSGKNTPQAYCAPDKMTKFSRLSRFGMTFAPLTEDRGEELLTLFRGAFPVRTLVLQDEGTDLTESVQECGKKWPGLLAKYDPNSHLWRTVQCSLLEDLNESLQTLPRWGMTVNGELYLLPTSVQNINEKEFGSWPTPNAWDGKRGPRSAENLATKKHQISLVTAVKHSLTTDYQNGGQLNPTWVEWLMGWPLGWTDLKPLEMDKSLSVQQPLGSS